MIATLTGVLAGKTSAGALIDVNGVGYQVMMPIPDLASLPAVGQQVKVFTYLQAKDDGMQLFGFESEAKKDIFVRLIGVNNVGPKGAVGLLSHLSPEQLIQAIIADDIGLISGAPGIGRKTAQRIVLELKDKLGGADFEAAPGLAASALVEARQALTALGYQPEEASAALTGAEEGRPADWYIKYALKRLAKV